MRMKLQIKIFSAFFLAAMVLIAFMVLSLRYFMQRHFTEFVNRTELERYAPLREALADEYRATGDWDRLRADPDAWRDIVIRVARQLYEQRQQASRAEERQATMPSPLQTKTLRDEASQQKLPHFARRLFLLDARKNLLAGEPKPPEEAVRQAITLDDRTVGWLGLRQRHSLRTPLEGAFLKQQYTLFYLLGGGLLAITALVSFVLSRHLLAPIKALITGTQALAARRFKTRIASHANDELGQLADDFNTLAKTLETYEQMRRQWMTDIAHELRTPLAVLRGEIEALLDGIRQVTPERLASLHSEVLNVSRIVEDLHAMSLADSGALVYREEPVCPALILEEALAHFAPRLSGRDIHVDNQLGPERKTTITGDPDRLGQLFANLLENAVRYTQSPGTLTLGQRRDQDRLQVWLEDSGPGVPDEALAHLFDRFYRVDPSRSRSLGGSGLGLSIARTIVETMGGQIHAERNVAGGLRVAMDFPISSRIAPESNPQGWGNDK
jgi:two-component system, OmpR family, sensor histidine kinase BaeS